MKSTFILRTTLEDAAAYMFDYESCCNRSLRHLQRTVVEKRGAFELLLETRTKEVLVGDNIRDGVEHVFLNKATLHITDEDTIIVLMDPIEHVGGGSNHGDYASSFETSSSPGSHFIREISAVKLTRVGEKETKVESIIDLQLDVSTTRKAMKNNLMRRANQNEMSVAYFLNKLCLEELSEKDGASFGELLCEENKNATGGNIGASTALSAFQAQFPWFESMMDNVLKNKLRPTPSPISTKAECISIMEARQIGESLAISLATNALASGGVDE